MTVGRFIRKLCSQSGEMNIVLLAAALPTLILVATASVDIIRFPAVKQQIRAAIHSSVRHLTTTFNGQVAPGTGMNWCVLPHPETSGYKCADQDACTADADCPTCGCSGGSDPSIGKYTLDTAGKYIIDSLMSGSSSVGFYKHSKDDIAIAIGIYNLLVNVSTGEVKQKELVYAFSGAELGVNLDLSTDLDSVIDKIIFNGDPKVLGVQIGTSASPKYFNVPVMAARVGVRVHHIFNFTTGFRFGNSSNAKSDSSVVVTTVIKPLPKVFALHGPVT
ncbi:MAG: hypothetical protein KDD66_01180 [Bdellovibrionales bacterium]|nr:hypothetical protein [Bdellovibrionales bacterium]